MKIAILSDIHDNLPRLHEALDICRQQKVITCICCGDIQRQETLEQIASGFEKVYLSFGNGDYQIARNSGLIPENVEYSQDPKEINIDGKRLIVVHYDYKARELAKSGNYAVVFYGHTHTPWEKKVGGTIMINPGEVAGHFGRPSFAIFDTQTMTAQLKILA